MQRIETENHKRRVLVSDFDGTLTREQFYRLVYDRLTPRSHPDYWVDYRAGRISHFQALKLCFAAAEGGERALLKLLPDMSLEPDLKAKISSLENAGWNVIVVSAGCSWYIERLLAGAGVNLPVFANRGDIVNGCLTMEPTADARFFSHDEGIDKALVVQWCWQNGHEVGFAGDGYPDLEAALLVPEHLRFARTDLAEALHAAGERFQPFEVWSDIVEELLRQSQIASGFR